MAIPNLPLNKILDDEFIETLAKSADLYKIGTNTVLDPEEIRIGLKVVPRAVMSMLISELTPMEINSHKDIHLPFGRSALIRVNKNAADDYTGSVYDSNKLVYDFKNRSIPGLGIILLSTFELYNMEELSKPHQDNDADKKVQKLIDERMELHSLVGRVVDNKMVEREAVHKLILARLNEELQKEKKKAEQISDVTKIAVDPGNAGANEYMRGMANGLVVADSIANDKRDPKFMEPPKNVAISSIATKPVAIPQSPTISEGDGPGPGVGPLSVKASDIVKKEMKPKKELPLKKFLDRKKKPKEYRVEMAKSETVDCQDCGQVIFGISGYSGCLCMGQDQFRKIWIKKSEDGVQLRFSRGWDEQNIEMLLETLRKNNGKH